jgi:hypothetical protein
MKRCIQQITLFVLCLALAPVVVANEGVRFAGSIKIEDQPSTPFDFVVGRNQVRFVELSSGYRLEAAATTQPEPRARTQVRLLKKEGDSYRIVHETVAQVPWGDSSTSSYAVCKGGVLHWSPGVSGSTAACP